MTEPLLRASTWLPAAQVDGRAFDDCVTLDHDGRGKRRHVVTTAAGRPLLIDLASPPRLRQGDALVCDDGRLVAVHAADEALMRIEAHDPDGLIRLAWHLGNRHLPVQVAEHGLIIRSDHVIAAMVEGLGGSITRFQGPFDPEPGAYHKHHDH